MQRALALIHKGALNEGTLAALAARLGVGERYLRKLFQRELGASPHAIALHRADAESDQQSKPGQ